MALEETLRHKAQEPLLHPGENDKMTQWSSSLHDGTISLSTKRWDFLIHVNVEAGTMQRKMALNQLCYFLPPTGSSPGGFARGIRPAWFCFLPMALKWCQGCWAALERADWFFLQSDAPRKGPLTALYWESHTCLEALPEDLRNYGHHGNLELWARTRGLQQAGLCLLLLPPLI